MQQAFKVIYFASFLILLIDADSILFSMHKQCACYPLLFNMLSLSCPDKQSPLLIGEARYVLQLPTDMFFLDSEIMGIKHINCLTAWQCASL